MIRTLNDPLGTIDECRATISRSDKRGVSAINHPCQTIIEPSDAKKASVGSTGLSVFAKTLSQVLIRSPFQPQPQTAEKKHG